MTTDTTATAEATVPPPLALSPARRACAEAAALRMGADEASARAFAEQGAILVDGILLAVTATAAGEGRWLATALVRRPEGVSLPRWSESLLLANGQALLVAPWIFTLEQGGDALLLMPLDPRLDDARTLAAHLDGMLSLCQSVAESAAAMAKDFRHTEEPV